MPWLIEKGARNVALLSRNAQSHPSAATIRESAAASGCSIMIRSCDVSDERQFLKELKEMSSTLPPIDGVINAAMLLQVGQL